MNFWMDVASIVFVCTSANHLGLVEAVEQVIGRTIPVVNCCKCFTFWSVLAYCSVGCNSFAALLHGIPWMLATSFLCAYLAVWLELAMGFIDRLYNCAYDKIYSPAADEPATSDTNGSNTEDGVS